MIDISNDQEFKSTLESLPAAQQRQVGARFIDQVFDLSDSPRIRSALDVARRPDAEDEEIRGAQRIARGVATETYTVCGKDGDWLRQASHFVAAATTTCLGSDEANAKIGWSTAMNARMARTCESIARNQIQEHKGAEEQYRILSEFLKEVGG